MNVMSLSLMNQSADWRLADEGIQVEKWTDCVLNARVVQFEVNALGNGSQCNDFSRGCA